MLERQQIFAEFFDALVMCAVDERTGAENLAEQRGCMNVTAQDAASLRKVRGKIKRVHLIFVGITVRTGGGKMGIQISAKVDVE